MKIVLGSTSKIKLTAVEAAVRSFALTATEVIAVKAQSRVAEQPLGDETLIGAENRARHAAELAPGAEIVLAIESGIFTEGAQFFDRAIAFALLPSGEKLYVKSDGVEFPKDAVEETIRRGVSEWTCGKVLAEWGRIEAHDDPHASLSGKPRVMYLLEAVQALFCQLREKGLL